MPRTINHDIRAHRVVAAIGVILVLGLVVACGSQSAIPTTPTTPSSNVPAAPAPGTPGTNAPVAVVARLDIDGSFVGGTIATGAVTLSAPASADALVTLSSSDPVATVPSSISIPAGSIRGTFDITTRQVTSTQDVTITAAAGGESRTAVVRIRAEPLNVTLEAASSTIGGGATVKLTVRLANPAPAGGRTFNLVSGDAILTLPSSVTVPAGATVQTVDMTTTAVSSERRVSLTAEFGDQSQRIFVMVIPVTLYFQSSSPNEYIGQGRTVSLHGPESTFAGYMVDDNRQMFLAVSFGRLFTWHLTIAAPPGQPLRPGRYTNATTLPYTTAQIDLSGEGRGCGQNGVGEFEVLEAEYGPPEPATGNQRSISGTILRFHARFTQRCSPTAPPLTGEVSLATIPRSATVR